MAEDPLAMAERHVEDLAAKVARQEELLAAMEHDHHPNAAERARALLTTYRETLRLAREHLEIERGLHGSGP